METFTTWKIKSTHYIITGISVVVGFSWNDAIRQFINEYFPIKSDAIQAKFIYCLLITFFLVLVIRYMPDTSNELPSNIQKKLGN